jgi:hypothetical protein
MCQLVPKDLTIDGPVKTPQQLLMEINQLIFPGKRIND